MAERAGIRPGDRVLDAGCGVGGPAIAIAAAIEDVRVDGVTISEVQVDAGKALVERAGLAGRVRLDRADFHELPFEAAAFDVALYLEVTNYSYDRERMFAETARVVKPGGRVYVKDVFRPESITPRQAIDIDEFEEMWACVRTPKVSETVAAMEHAGFTDIEVNEYPYLGANRFIGSMIDIRSGRPVPNELGREFLRTFADLPVFYREVRAQRAAPDRSVGPERGG
jgi:cyclopropane fatty-acyl-phospholipid synthase-like methyltransferase